MLGIFPSTVVREHLALSPSNHCYSLRKQLDDTNILTHAKCALQLRYSGNFKLDNWQFSIDSNTFSLAALAVKRDVTSNLHIHNKIVSLRGESSIAQLFVYTRPFLYAKGRVPRLSCCYLISRHCFQEIRVTQTLVVCLEPQAILCERAVLTSIHFHD